MGIGVDRVWIVVGNVLIPKDEGREGVGQKRETTCLSRVEQCHTVETYTKWVKSDVYASPLISFCAGESFAKFLDKFK